MTVDISFLRNISYFKGLQEMELDLMKKYFVEKIFNRGEIILMDGQQSRALYFVASGAAKIFKTSMEGKEQILGIARPGDSFNEVPVFDGGLNTVSTQAMSSITLYELDKSAVDAIIRKYPQVAMNVINILAARIRGLIVLVEDLSFRSVIGRVAKILLQTAQNKLPGPRLTQNEMAAMAGTAREVVGRSLKALEEDGVIRIDQHRIIVRNTEALKKVASANI